MTTNIYNRDLQQRHADQIANRAVELQKKSPGLSLPTAFFQAGLQIEIEARQSTDGNTEHARARTITNRAHEIMRADAGTTPFSAYLAAIKEEARAKTNSQ